MQSSDPNFQQSADSRKLASAAPKKSRKRFVPKKIEAVFCFSEVACFRKIRENICVFGKKGPTSLRSGDSGFSEVGFLFMRTCLLPFFPPPLLLFSRPTPNFILVHPSTICSAEHVIIVAFPYSWATHRAIRSDRPDPAEICRHRVWTT